jgi:hypothetical protein
MMSKAEWANFGLAKPRFRNWDFRRKIRKTNFKQFPARKSLFIRHEYVEINSMILYTNVRCLTRNTFAIVNRISTTLLSQYRTGRSSTRSHGTPQQQ